VPEWRFLSVRPGERIRESVLSEFFNTSSIGDAGEALVREGIQNSLDARVSQDEPVRVRIFLSGVDTDLELDFLSGFWETLKPHLEACGLISQPDEPVRFLTFEDFNTTGLEGDVNQWQKIEKTDNPFFTYFRAEGWSQKDHGGGRWGVGKFAFPRSSRYQTHFALSVRHSDNRRIAVGQAILKYHNIGSETAYVPDGWFGEFKDTLGLPIENRTFLEEFSGTFFLKRTEQDTGLSVVVPFLDEEISFESLISGVISQFFMPILNGDLEVELQHDIMEPLLVSSETLKKQIFTKYIDEKTVIAIRQAEWLITNLEIPTVLISMSDGSPRWDRVVVQEPEQARVIHQTSDRYLVKIECDIIRKGEEKKRGEFFIVFERNEAIHEPIFVRQMLRISEVSSKSPRGFSALVYIPDGPLGDMLGDAENPAHTNWFYHSKNFKGFYLYGKPMIEFLRKAPSGVVKAILGDEENGRDMDLLADVFNIPLMTAMPTPRGKSNGTEPGRNGAADKISAPPPAPAAYSIHLGDRLGEVSIKGQEVTSPIKRLLLKFAYDSRTGSPLKRYSKYDFELNEGQTKVVITGCSIVICRANQLLLAIEEPNFTVTVSGFDAKRDVFVSARATKNQENLDG